jgi:hypothetical protein
VDRFLIGAARLVVYSANLTTTGTITYGLGMGWARLGGPQQFAAIYPGGTVNPSWAINSNSVGKSESCKEQTTLATNDGLTDRRLAPGLQFSASTDSGKYESKVTGYIQDERGFIYQGRDPLQMTVRVTFQADVYFGNNNVGYGTFKLYAWRGLYDRTASQWVANSYTSWSFWNPDIMKHDLQFGTKGVVTQECNVSLVPGHTYGWIVGVQSDTDMKAANDPYSAGLDVRNMRSILYLKGVTLHFL